jgi:hypothetical protein
MPNDNEPFMLRTAHTESIHQIGTHILRGTILSPPADRIDPPFRLLFQTSVCQAFFELQSQNIPASPDLIDSMTGSFTTSYHNMTYARAEDLNTQLKERIAFLYDQASRIALGQSPAHVTTFTFTAEARPTCFD